MADRVAITAMRLQEKSCDIGNGEVLRFPHNAEMDVEWIREQLTKPGKTQAGLARALGINPSGINRLLGGDRELKASEIEKVRAYFGSRPSTLAAKPAFQNDANDGSAELLPVLGMAEGGPDGWNLWNGDNIGTIRRPDNLVGVAGAYAVYVTGSSMEPRYYAGDLAHVHPWRPITPGCFVLVQKKPKNEEDPPLAVIKKLVKRSGSKVVLEQLSPPKTFELKAGEIFSMHRVVGSSEA